MHNKLSVSNIRKFAVAGYIILPLQLILSGFWVLQGIAGVSIDYVNLGFGFMPSDYLFSIVFLFNSTLLIFFGFSIYGFGVTLSSKSLYISGLFIIFLNKVFLITTLFQRFARLPDTPFLFGFYYNLDPEWIFWILRLYSLLSLIFLIWVGVSLTIIGWKGMRKILVVGIILLLGVIAGILLDFLNMGALSFLSLYIGIPFVSRQIRLNLLSNSSIPS